MNLSAFLFLLIASLSFAAEQPLPNNGSEMNNKSKDELILEFLDALVSDNEEAALRLSTVHCVHIHFCESPDLFKSAIDANKPKNILFCLAEILQSSQKLNRLALADYVIQEGSHIELVDVILGDILSAECIYHSIELAINSGHLHTTRYLGDVWHTEQAVRMADAEHQNSPVREVESLYPKVFGLRLVVAGVQDPILRCQLNGILAEPTGPFASLLQTCERIRIYASVLGGLIQCQHTEPQLVISCCHWFVNDMLMDMSKTEEVMRRNKELILGMEIYQSLKIFYFLHLISESEDGVAFVPSEIIKETAKLVLQKIDAIIIY